ncbi:hypothetical protein OG394_14255 [Kribbella sp. NBC_01245]|uniref:hypothetical protein n=1 Tax=Kribbella sp. NBC_01245 TaxID=2903578 RepID=UPI002E2BB7FC|nr:hypothetical protein [Kribbella sp. NBC_01245]
MFTLLTPLLVALEEAAAGGQPSKWLFGLFALVVLFGLLAVTLILGKGRRQN